MLLTLLTLSSVTLGCASTTLSNAGKEVKILKHLSISELDSYDEVGTISCNFGFNFRSSSDNIKQCRDDLRNKSAQIGASILIIDHQQLGNSNDCPNCITMTGTAYKLRSQ